MQITLPPEVQTIIDRELESGRFATQEDVIVEALKQLDHESETYDPMRDPQVKEVIRQMERGETRELTEEVWAEIREKANEDARNRAPIPDDIKYRTSHISTS